MKLTNTPIVAETFRAFKKNIRERAGKHQGAGGKS